MYVKFTDLSTYRGLIHSYYLIHVEHIQLHKQTQTIHNLFKGGQKARMSPIMIISVFLIEIDCA